MMDFKECLAWQKAQDLCVFYHKNLEFKLPSSERNNIQDQIKRAASSIQANIAEGISRELGSKDLIHFLKMAKGSAGEVESFLLLAEKEEYYSRTEIEPALQLCTEIKHLICGLIRRERKLMED